MSLLSMLYSVLLMPIQLLFETVFTAAYYVSDSKAGVAIVALSLAINLLILPLYRRADAMQEEERLTEQRLRPGVEHIKKTFHGSERTMMLQTYYRQNHYSPLYTLRGAVSLLLEIPFFIAAYRFLSGLSLLQGVTFGPIADLGVPDGLITVGSLQINVLPVLMTAINVVSTVIFTKGYPLKSKLQLYGMAAFFLVFLYDSPAGLVFYWTLNNLFSLVKTIFYKIKNPEKTLSVLLFVSGILLAGYGVLSYSRSGLGCTLITYLGIGAVLCVPLPAGRVIKKLLAKLPEIKALPSRKMFFAASLLLTLLTGVLIPSSVIADSPQEFIVVGSFLHPVWYVVSSLLTAVGFFMLWMGIFYWLFSKKVKVVFERVLLVLGVTGVINYLFFGGHFGTMSPDLSYEREMLYTPGEMLLNLAVILAAAAVVVLLANKKARVACSAAAVAAAAMLCMSVINISGIVSSVSEVDTEAMTDTQPKAAFTLSKEGQNVVVIMLDRAMGEYVPYIMSEYPALAEQYSGFTYYSNVISYGAHTNFGVPALFGGYEYTPLEMNKRNTETLVSKHNEALKMMPVLFDRQGYDVTVSDPPYAGYKEIPDLSIYKDYPDIKTYITFGTMADPADTDQMIASRHRNFFCHSIVKAAPRCLQWLLYCDATYCSQSVSFIELNKSYDVLKKMPEMTQVKESDDGAKGSFIMFENDTSHNSVMFADEDFLTPTNDLYGSQSKGNITLDGVTLHLESQLQVGSYHSNIAAYMRLGEWFDYLREQGVYDNTRIILAADHGWGRGQISELMFGDFDRAEVLYRRHNDPEFFFPLLMVKDFGSSGPLMTSGKFMTNADVPTLAVQGLIENPTNPFTGKPIDNSEKTARDQYILESGEYSVHHNNGKTFLPGQWYTVHDSIWNKENWQLVAENSVMPY